MADTESLSDEIQDASEPSWELTGFVRPYFKVIHRAEAQPEDQLELGMGGTRVGLVFSGNAWERWDFKTNLQVGGDTIPAVTSISTVDLDNNGSVDADFCGKRAILQRFSRSPRKCN